jgi:hypothetical protein
MIESVFSMFLDDWALREQSEDLSNCVNIAEIGEIFLNLPLGH